MKFTYEKACVCAGLTEEQADEIRKVFSRDRDRKRNRNRAMRKSGFCFYSVSDHSAWLMNSNGVEPEDDFQIPDPDTDVEREAIHNLQLWELRKMMERLSEEEREFLLESFGAGEPIKKMAERYGVSKAEIIRRRDLLVKRLRRLMKVDESGNNEGRRECSHGAG